jgi:hypothetical protein
MKLDETPKFAAILSPKCPAVLNPHLKPKKTTCKEVPKQHLGTPLS